MTLLVDIRNLSMTTAGWHVVLQSKGPTVLMHVEAHTMAQAFEKRKSFHFEVNWKGDRRQGSQICLHNPELRVKFKGLGECHTYRRIG